MTMTLLMSALTHVCIYGVCERCLLNKT